MSTMSLLSRVRRGRSAGNVYPSERSPSFERALPADRRALLERGEAVPKSPYVGRRLWRVFYEFMATAPLVEIEAYVTQVEREAAERKRVRAEEARRQRREDRRYAGAVRLAFDPDDRRKQKLAGELVWLYHGTSSKLLPKIRREGLCPSPPKASFASTTPGYVYLTAHRAQYYAWHASGQFGGRPIVLRVRVPWDDLEPDDDDSDLAIGRDQYRYPSCIPAHDIVEVISVP